MSRAIKVSIEEFKEKTGAFLKKYAEYMDKLAAINIAENKDIEELCGKPHLNYWTEFEEKYPEKVEERKKLRKQLKEEYGEYTSYYNCPYYCLVTNLKELYELFKDRLKAGDKDLKSKDSIYNYHRRTLKKWVGKKVQNEIGEDVYGICKGVAFFVDQDYWYIIDEKTKKEAFCLHIQPFNIWDHRCWRIVENGQDYL